MVGHPPMPALSLSRRIRFPPTVPSSSLMICLSQQSSRAQGKNLILFSGAGGWAAERESWVGPAAGLLSCCGCCGEMGCSHSGDTSDVQSHSGEACSSLCSIGLSQSLAGHGALGAGTWFEALGSTRRGEAWGAGHFTYLCGSSQSGRGPSWPVSFTYPRAQAQSPDRGCLRDEHLCVALTSGIS